MTDINISLFMWSAESGGPSKMEIGFKSAFMQANLIAFI